MEWSPDTFEKSASKENISCLARNSRNENFNLERHCDLSSIKDISPSISNDVK